MERPRYDVFLSHTSSDKPVVEELARLLRERGIEPWLDVWHLVPGAPWQEAIEKALQSCATVAVCLGPSGTGPWQNEEMRAAINRRVTDKEGTFRVIPVLLPGAVRGEPSRLPMFLTATTWVEFRGTLDDPRALHRLVCGIRGVEPDPALENLVVVEGVSPYRGLRFFDVEDSRFFFGREALTQWLLDKLRPASVENRFLAVVGPSGSGKSSLARAGLLASLQKGEIAGSEDWPVAISKPGAQPLESLAVALASAARLDSSPLALMRDLGADARTLHLTTRLALHDSPAARRFVVLVDQFEEVFTLCPDETQRRSFIDNLLHAATTAEGRTVIVLTLRADFYGRCAAYPNLAAAVSDRQILVGAMTPEELRRAIERPAHLAGCELEAGLADLLLEEVEEQPGSLPLLQHALLQLWDRRKGRKLTVEAYREIGGVDGALEKHAEEIYDGLPATEKEVCRRVLLRLVQIGEGTVPTRCRLLFDDLKPVDEAGGRAVEDVVRKLADARLLTTDQTENPTVELAHEALITGWKRLKAWIETDREALLVRRRLDDALREWLENKKDPSYLYRDARLAQAEVWASTRAAELSRPEREFLDASLALRDEERRREREQARRFKRLAAGLAAGLALALAAGVVAVLQARQAERRRMTAVARELGSRVEPVFRTQPITGLLLAVQAVRLAREGEDPEIPALEEALRSVLASSGGRPLPSGRVTAVTVTPDRRWLATAGEDRKVRIWDLGSDDPAASGRVLADLDEGPASGLALSGDRRWLLTRAVDGAHARIFLRDLSSKQGKRELPEEDWLDGSDPFSPDSRWLLTNESGEPVLRDLRTFQDRRPADGEIQALGFRSAEGLAAFGPDDRWLVDQVGKEAPRIWDVREGPAAGLEPALTHHPFAEALALEEEGRRLVADLVADGHEDIRILDLAGRAASRKLPDSRGDFGIGWVFGPSRVAVPTREGAILLWDLPAQGGMRPPVRLRGCATRFPEVALGPGGGWLAGGCRDGSVYLWDLRNPRVTPKHLTNHHGSVTALAFGPGDGSVATAGNEGIVRLYNLRGDEPRVEVVLEKAKSTVTALAYSQDGAWLAIARRGELELRTPKENVRLEIPGGDVGALAFSPDRRRLAGHEIGGDAWIWHLDGHRPDPDPVLLPADELLGDDLKIQALAFDSDGRRLITASNGGIVRRWTLGLDELVKIACEMAGRDLTREEWEEHLPSEPFRQGAPCSAP